MQRLYKRRRTGKDGYIKSNWSVLREDSVLNGHNPIDDLYDDDVTIETWDGGFV